MKTRFTVLTIAALATFSAAALAPTKASAWGMHGYGGGYGGGFYHFEGSYRPQFWSRPWRPTYNTSFAVYAPSAPVYAPVHAAYAPAPVTAPMHLLRS